MQENWIGRSYGVNLGFPYELGTARRRQLRVFTTRADTIMGVTFVAIAAEHPLATHLRARQPEARGIHRGVQAGAASPKPTSRRRKRRAWRRASTSRIR